MKKHTTILFMAGLMAVVIIMAGFSNNDLKSSGGAPAGNTNSPGDGQNCSHCMGGTPVPVTGWITSDIPATGYVPGSTYTITVTATGTGKKGFQVSPQDVSGALIGTLIAGTGNKLVGSNKYVTHVAALTPDPSTWAFQWTAPSSGVGNVTFYGSVAVGKTNTKTTTMTVSQSTVGLDENRKVDLSVFPNPAREKITVSFLQDIAGIVSLDLVNIRGEKVLALMQESVAAGQFTKSFTLDQPAGSYLLRLSAKGKTGTVKLVLVK